jgi:hypothetical protein
MFRRVPALPALLALAGAVVVGCGPTFTGPRLDPSAVAAERDRQHELYRLLHIDAYRRVNRVAWPMLVAGAELCAARGEARIRPPAVLGAASRVDRAEDRAAARLEVGNEVMVLAALEPNAPGGVRDDDIVVAVDRGLVPPGATAVVAARRMIEEASGKAYAPVTLRVRRGGKEYDAVIQPRRACLYPVDIWDSRQINAFANGKKVMVLTELLRFLTTDPDLATVLGHEIAHNLGGHADIMRRNIGIGRALDALSGPNVTEAQRAAGAWRRQDFEREADYIGLYLMARARYPIDDAPNVWRKFALSNPRSIEANALSTHPSYPERFVLLDRTVQEIKAKQASAQPLLPQR